ncbi:MAG TPA: hypothetical protein VFR28_10355 [Allosphingosinicella sp.]|jgi:hypothetical protein|nr:hypothetical protein [Allosphingosinicella sp.]
MRIGLFALALTLPAASSAVPPAPGAYPAAAPRSAAAALPSRICGNDLQPRHVRSPRAAKASRLGELPPGNLTLTVVNRVGDCIEPVTVRQGYGSLGGR